MAEAARSEVKYEYLSLKFQQKSFNYQKQYCHLYTTRLTEMSVLLKKTLRAKWCKNFEIRRLSELKVSHQEPSIIIGTLYKRQAHKPSILREISEENQLAPQPQRLHYADDDDELVMEDELQRVRLCGALEIDKFSTGVVCALLGNLSEGGRFEVVDYFCYEGGPQRPLRANMASGNFIVLMSGLDQLKSHDYVDELNLFQHWLGGNLGISGCKAVRLIIAGNSVSSVAKPHQTPLQCQSNQQSAAEAEKVVAAVQQLDTYFAAWSRTLRVDVMPGAHDPASFMLPQQPFHKCMFPQAAKLDSFRCVPNPYACAVNDVLIVGTAGQNVQDLLRCTSITNPLEALRSTLKWSHIAPTAPDTLACYPYICRDPFILRNCPHIYYAGNCNKFATDLHQSLDKEKSTRLVCVPNFAETRSVAVVQLDTLACHQVSFAVQTV